MNNKFFPSFFSVFVASLLACVLIPAVSDAAEESPESDLEALPIGLPRPFFSDSPLQYTSPNLEPLSWRPRKPFMAPKGASNVVKGKTFTGSVEKPRQGDLAQITDGEKSFRDKSVVTIDSGLQYVQVDLGAEYEIYAILVWHYHGEERVYHDFIVQVSSGPEFGEEDTKVIYNNDYDNSSTMGKGKDNEYIESYEGRLVDAKGVKGRYVRLYSNGSTSSKANHYIEVEVYGKPTS